MAALTAARRAHAEGWAPRASTARSQAQRSGLTSREATPQGRGWLLWFLYETPRPNIHRIAQRRGAPRRHRSGNKRQNL